MKTNVNIASRLETFSKEKVAFTRSETIEEIGTRAAAALADLVSKGRLSNPGRGVYTLPGINDEDPRLQAALLRARSNLYPASRRVKSHATPLAKVEGRALKSEPKNDLSSRIICWLQANKVGTITDIQADLGEQVSAALIKLAVDGLVKRITASVYSGLDVLDDDPSVAMLLSQQAATESAVTAAIDRARIAYQNKKNDPALADKAILRLWDRKDPLGDRNPISRVYIDIPGYPPFFAQRRLSQNPNDESDIAWNSANENIGPEEAQTLARKLFNPVPKSFADLASNIPDGKASILPLIIRSDAHDEISTANDPAPVSAEMRHLLPCAYVVSDTDRLDPTSLKHPIPEPILLRVSSKEPPAIITALRRVKNLELALTELQVGQYEVPGRIIIARQSAEDFDTSISNGAIALMQMAETMSQANAHRILLIEGGPYAKRHYGLNRLASTLSYLQNVHHIHVTPTMNMRHSAYVIVQAIKHNLYGMHSTYRPASNDENEIRHEPGQIARRMICQLSGISDERANSLLQHFKTLKNIASATQKELGKVKGIGPKAAAHIASVFGAETGI